MARTEARIKTTIWSDPDFLALSHGAQWMYHLILEQPELSLCGVAALTVGRWASRSVTTTPRDVRTFLKELHAARYILMDDETEEVWVRTFIKNDGVLDSPNALVGMTNDFIGICSDAIRKGVAEGLPEGFLQGLPEGVSKRIREAFVKGYTRACAPTASASASASTEKPATQEPGRVDVPNSVPIPDDFPEFWNLYPKRHDKKVGKATSGRLWSKLSHGDRAVALSAVTNYAEACDTALTISKDPERWLRGRCWVDWLEPAKVAASTRAVGGVLAGSVAFGDSYYGKSQR